MGCSKTNKCKCDQCKCKPKKVYPCPPEEKGCPPVNTNGLKSDCCDNLDDRITDLERGQTSNDIEIDRLNKHAIVCLFNDGCDLIARNFAGVTRTIGNICNIICQAAIECGVITDNHKQLFCIDGQLCKSSCVPQVIANDNSTVFGTCIAIAANITSYKHPEPIYSNQISNPTGCRKLVEVILNIREEALVNIEIGYNHFYIVSLDGIPTKNALGFTYEGAPASVVQQPDVDEILEFLPGNPHPIHRSGGTLTTNFILEPSTSKLFEVFFYSAYEVSPVTDVSHQRMTADIKLFTIQ